MTCRSWYPCTPYTLFSGLARIKHASKTKQAQVFSALRRRFKLPPWFGSDSVLSPSISIKPTKNSYASKFHQLAVVTVEFGV